MYYHVLWVYRESELNLVLGICAQPGNGRNSVSLVICEVEQESVFSTNIEVASFPPLRSVHCVTPGSLQVKIRIATVIVVLVSWMGQDFWFVGRCLIPSLANATRNRVGLRTRVVNRVARPAVWLDGDEFVVRVPIDLKAGTLVHFVAEKYEADLDMTLTVGIKIHCVQPFLPVKMH